MIQRVIEASYPISFREEDAKRLGEQLRHRRSIDLIGMKRVGISNFLRFFLYHKDIVPIYINGDENHLFIPVDLNDLVEREIYPFWVLTFKRICDACQGASLTDEVRERIEQLFISCIQSQDLFLLIDGIRQALHLLSNQGIKPTIFLLRFDRIKDVVTPSFFDNLQGLKDATNGELAYVFTSYRSLDILAPSVFEKTSLSVFAQPVSLTPATNEDMKIIYDTYNTKFHLSLSPQLEDSLFTLVGGYVQYLQLALLILQEQQGEITTEEKLFTALTTDERITLQSEELWESLTTEERAVLVKVKQDETISDTEAEKTRYLWDTGFIHTDGAKPGLFSSLFASYLESISIEEDERGDAKNVHFSRKEQQLFSILTEHKNEVCDRDIIIKAVWPEYAELGVSDWAIDRLVSRVRGKLKRQGGEEEIVTIRTRGYKLTTHLIATS